MLFYFLTLVRSFGWLMGKEVTGQEATYQGMPCVQQLLFGQQHLMLQLRLIHR